MLWFLHQNLLSDLQLFWWDRFIRHKRGNWSVPSRLVGSGGVGGQLRVVDVWENEVRGAGSWSTTRESLRLKGRQRGHTSWGEEEGSQQGNWAMTLTLTEPPSPILDKWLIQSLLASSERLSCSADTCFGSTEGPFTEDRCFGCERPAPAVPLSDFLTSFPVTLETTSEPKKASFLIQTETIINALKSSNALWQTGS